MKQIFTIISIILFAFSLYAESNTTNPIKIAIKKKDTDYFKKVSIEELKKWNLPNSAGKTVFERVKIKDLHALIGAFENPNNEVRLLIYTTLQFKDIQEGTPLSVVKNDSSMTDTLNQFREAMYSKIEVDKNLNTKKYELIKIWGYTLEESIKEKKHKAIASFDVASFQKENLANGKNLVASTGKLAVNPILFALQLDHIDLELKRVLIKELLFEKIGGPKAVVIVGANRLKKAERIFQIADKEKDPETKKMLIYLGEQYYIDSE